MKTFCLFTGCSFASGTGWEHERHDDRLWAVQLHQTTPKLKAHEYLNLGAAGASNSRIFYETTAALINYPCAYAFVAWTELHRITLDVGFELYDCTQMFGPHTLTRDHRINGMTLSARYLKKVGDRFLTLMHDHREIWWLIRYINVLIKIGEKLGTKIFFINSLCPWDFDFFNHQQPVAPSDLTNYTQQLLNVDNRDDQEIFQLYHLMHQDYADQGSIQQPHWLNLYNSIQSLKIDFNSDGSHPGEKTNQLVASLLQSNLNQ